MIRTNESLLSAAIRRALRDARVMRAASARSIALVACAASAWMPPANAADHTAGTETELRQAIADANADPDLTVTVTLTSNINLASSNAFATIARPITLNTGTFTLSAASTAAVPVFQGGPLTVNGTVRGVGGSTGSSGLSMPSGGTLIIGATVSGGAGTSGAGGTAVNASNATITVTSSGVLQGGNTASTFNSGGGAVVGTNVHLIIEGTIAAGTSGTGTRANVLSFTSGTNVIELRAGYNIIGGIRLLGSNTYVLGGTADSTLNVSNIGFPGSWATAGAYKKTGTSTWTLTGTTNANTSWQILGGTLAASSNSGLGGVAATLTFDGGTLQNTAAFTAPRTVTINGGGGTFRTDADLTWSGVIDGTGSLTKTGSGALILTGNDTYAGGTTISAGTLQLGAGGNTGNITGNVLNNGTLAFNRSDVVTFANAISGAGTVSQNGSGVAILSAGNTYSGATNVNAGTLRINGDQSAATGLVSVANGATLGGSGAIGGAVTIADGGRIAAGNSPGTLTMGSLTLSAGSILDFELGEANVVGGSLNDLINVNGDVQLDGTLNVALAAGGTYGAGIYRLINYTGALTDNGLDLGLMPASSANYIQTSVANQVNLINTQGLVLSYWDGASDARNNGHIGGGNGIWRATGNENWTTADGAINAPYQSASMPVFSQTGGTITVDGSAGAIAVSGLQFASDGYRIEGDAITLTTGTNSIRVGDGTDAGTGYTATIASELTGDGTLEKTDLGTLLLAGDNTYTGGTTISAGTLQLGAGGTSGSLGGDVTNNGTLVFNRSDALTLAGVISGSGVLRQSGTGTTVLSGAGSTVSNLGIERGTLEVANGASLSAVTTTIASGTTLRNGGTFTGTAGDNTLTLAGTLIGHVDLLDGSDQVQIGAGADFSQASFEGGAGVDALDLTTSSAFTLPSALATGFESLVKHGSGELTFSGAVNDFSESITIAEGDVHLDNAVLQVNELRIEPGVTVTGTGSLSGSLQNAGVLSPGNSPGTIQIAGNYTQAAGGTLVSEISKSGTDLLDISGSAALAGTHQIQVEYGLYLDGTTQTLIQAAGGISGDFDSVQINPNALTSATRALSANAETVSFARQPFTSLADLSDGRVRLATYLEEQIDSGNVGAAMTDYIDSLLQQPTAHGVASLLGERGEPVAAVTQNSVSILGAGFARTVFERFTLSDNAQCTPTQQASSDALNCFWAHGLRQWGNASGDVRYDWTSNGGQIGADRILSSNVALGATFGYAGTDTHDENGGGNQARSKMAGLYANYAPGRLTLGALACYSFNDNDTTRSVLVDSTRQQAEADFDSDSYGAGVRLGYRVTGDQGPLVRPFIEAFYDHLKGTEFAETGAGDGNLSARVHGRDGLRGTLGVQLADNYEGYGKVFRPALELGVAHQFADVRSIIDLQPFSNAPAFRTEGPALDRTAYLARASLNVSLGDNGSLAFGYGGELADDYFQHEANLSFRIAW